MAARSRESFTKGGASGASPSSKGGGGRPRGPIKPHELAEYDGPLWVKNLTGAVISHDDGRGNYLRIEPVHSGLNVESLPLEVATNANFQRLWRRGKIEVSSDPAMEDSLYFADDVFEQKEAAKQAALGASLEENPANRDLVQESCLKCGDTFFTTAAETNLVPPLCDLHKPMEASFVPVPTPNGKGEVITKWVSATVTRTQKDINPEG